MKNASEKHNRFLRSLKEDTLMIVDNFNATSIQDSFSFGHTQIPLSDIIYYQKPSWTDIPVCCWKKFPIKQRLLQLAGKFFSDTEEKSDVIEQIIEAVHAHTLAVELASRLTGNRNIGTRNALKKIVGRKCRS